MLGVGFLFSTFVSCEGGVLVALGRLTQASNWSWSAFSFLSSSLWHHSIFAIHVWSCWRVSLFFMVVRGGLELYRGVSCLRSNRVLTIGEKRPRGKYYHSSTVGAKCTYQNLELIDVRVDVAKMDSTISHVELHVPFTGRTKGGRLVDILFSTISLR